MYKPLEVDAAPGTRTVDVKLSHSLKSPPIRNKGSFPSISEKVLPGTGSPIKRMINVS